MPIAKSVKSLGHFHIGMSYDGGMICDIVSYAHILKGYIVVSCAGHKKKYNIKRVTRHKWCVTKTNRR